LHTWGFGVELALDHDQDVIKHIKFALAHRLRTTQTASFL
jgi:hypothetical protein